MFLTKGMKGALALVVGLSVVPLVQAQSFTVLTSFNGVDGAFPSAGLVRDTAGNLYRATEFANPATGAGNAFKLDPTGKELCSSVSPEEPMADTPRGG